MKSTDNNAENQIELSFIGLLTILVLQRRLIAMCTLIFIALGLVYVYAIKVPSYTATATIIADKNIPVELLVSLGQSSAIKQPLSQALKQGGFITDADIANELEGIYTTSSKSGPIQLSLRIKDAAAAQQQINDTARRIVDLAKNMQLSETGQKLGKLAMAKADITKDLAKLGPVTLSPTERAELMPYVLPIVALESSTIVEGSEPQLVQKMQEEVAHLLQTSKVPQISSQLQQDQFLQLYKTQVLQRLDREIAILRQQEQSQVIAIPAALPQKADKPGKALLLLLFTTVGGIIGIYSAFMVYVIKKNQHTPEWEQLRRAFRR